MNKLVIVGVVAALIIGSVVSFYYPSTNSLANPPPATQIADCTRPPGYFLIIVDLTGFNDSVDHLQQAPNDPWPVIQVSRGTEVNILVCSDDSYSPHGFAIQHYFDQGIAIMPHQSFKISFLADQDGTFTIYCNIFCPVHPYMQSGQLIVTG